MIRILLKVFWMWCLIALLVVFARDELDFVYRAF